MCPDEKNTVQDPVKDTSTHLDPSAVDQEVPAEGEQGSQNRHMTRRTFVAGVGIVGAGLVAGGSLLYGLLLPNQIFAVPASGGYLLVDTKKCAGCSTCMMACALGHTGKTGYSYSRLQILQDTFGKFPYDITISQCLQCKEPQCLDACPTQAMYVDRDTGVRMVDARKCIGCEKCVEACPYEPVRVAWDSENGVAMKCDLCLNTPYWDEEGGPNGKRACETYCPWHAITFTDSMPEQSLEGYEVDLRTPVDWNFYGYEGDKESGELPTFGIGAASLGAAKAKLQAQQKTEQ